MANWCTNIVGFAASGDAINNIQQLVISMEARQRQTEEGQLPEFFKAGTGYIFDPHWECGTLYYQTKFCPNVEVIKSIADHFGIASFTHQYEEPGNLIYGEFTYANGILKDICLDSEDFDLFEENEDGDSWAFEGNVYDSYSEILEILLERKRLQGAYYIIK